jgi:hypothetical protein
LQRVVVGAASDAGAVTRLDFFVYVCAASCRFAALNTEVRMRKIALGFIALAAIGCGEDQNASGVFPSEGFLGRTMRVQISGDNTQWNDGVSVDFGPNITVKSVSAASPTTLFADIEIGADAAPGLRDVVINDGQDLALHNAFSLESPIKVEMQGSLAQGSIVNFTVRNLDFDAPFDDTCTSGGLFGCNEYGNVAIESPPGTIAQVSSVSPYTLSGALLLDIDAAPGPFSVLSGAGDTATISPLGAQIEVAARAPTSFNGQTIATVMAPFESHFYEVSAAANTLQRFSASSDGTPPSLYILGESGKFIDYVAGGEAPVVLQTAASKLHVVAVDGSGESGFAYTLRDQPLTMQTTAESDPAVAAENNNTFAKAQAVALTQAALVTGATISVVTDADWYKVTVPAGSSAKHVRVMTSGSDPYTDVAVEIHADTNGNIIGSADDGYHEDVTSEGTVGAAAAIYVKIFSDPKYYDPAHTPYVAAIWFE